MRWDHGVARSDPGCLEAYSRVCHPAQRPVRPGAARALGAGRVTLLGDDVRPEGVRGPADPADAGDRGAGGRSGRRGQMANVAAVGLRGALMTRVPLLVQLKQRDRVVWHEA